MPLVPDPVEVPTPTRRRRLLAVGQLSVDTVVALDRPLADGDQTVGTFSASPGGTAAIVAHNAATLGAAAAFAGHVGDGPDDAAVLRRLADRGVEIGPLVHTEIGLRVMVLVAPDGERTMISNAISPSWSELHLDLCEDDLVYFEGWHLFDADRSGYLRLIEEAAAAGATTALDVCSASRAPIAEHARLLRDLPVDYLFANEAETATYGLLDLEPRAAVVAHRGRRSTLVRRRRHLDEVPLDPVDVVDTTGAGDTFAAGFLAALASDRDVLEAVDAGHAAARDVVQVFGALLDPSGAEPEPAPGGTR